MRTPVVELDGAAHEPGEAKDLQRVAGGMAARDEGRPYGASRRENGIFVMSPAHLLGVGRRVGDGLYKSPRRSRSTANPT
jgi:hypothetical protein